MILIPDRPFWQTLISVMFASGCALVGAILLVGLGGGSIYDWWRTREEISVEAVLLSVELKTVRRSTSICVKYVYTVGERRFTGNRIAVMRNPFDFYPELYDAHAKK